MNHTISICYVACLSPLRDSREPQISQAKRHPVRRKAPGKTPYPLAAHHHHSPDRQTETIVIIGNGFLRRLWLKTTPGAYYRKLRLDQARQMLQLTDFPIIDVAIECVVVVLPSVYISNEREFTAIGLLGLLWAKTLILIT